MSFDTSQLTPTSTKRGLRWREPALTMIWLRVDGPIFVAHTIDEKRGVLAQCIDGDRLLVVRQVQYPRRQEVMVVDDVGTARAALSAA